MAEIYGDRLITLLQTKNQTIYVFNADDPTEYYTESFFAPYGSRWVFAVIPHRSDSKHDLYTITIIQTDHQTITVHALIPDKSISNVELRAGILNYYSTNLADKYVYTIGYQDIRVFATTASNYTVNDIFYLFDIIQVPNQTIFLYSDTEDVYAYSTSLKKDSEWKAVLVADPGYKPGRLVVTYPDGEKETLPNNSVASGLATGSHIITATAASEIKSNTTLIPGKFDSTDDNLCNSDDYIEFGIGSEISSDKFKVHLYSSSKIVGDKVLFNKALTNTFYAALGDPSYVEATPILYGTSASKQSVLSAFPGYYGYRHFVGYLDTYLPNTRMTPYRYADNNVEIVGFGFGTKDAPVDEDTIGYWFIILEDLGIELPFSILRLSIYDDSGFRIFRMNAAAEFFTKVDDPNYNGKLIYEQRSKDGINDDAYIFLSQKLKQSVKINVQLLD
jgi:hypothetical protein